MLMGVVRGGSSFRPDRIPETQQPAREDHVEIHALTRRNEHIACMVINVERLLVILLGSLKLGK